MSDLLGAGGEQITADSIRADIALQRQQRVDELIANYRDSELGIFDAEAVRELGKHTI